MSAPSIEERAGGKGLRLVLLALIALGLGAIWYLAGGGGATAKPALPASTPANESGQATPPWQGGGGASASTKTDPADPEATPKLDAWLDTNWELPDPELIDGLLQFSRRRDLSMIEKAKALEHVLNLLPDQEYGKLDPLLTDPATPGAMLGSIYTDMHNRNEQAAIHASLLFLKRPEIESATNGKALLAHLLDMDEESDTEAIRMQAETRLIELAEAETDMDTVEMAPDAEAPPPQLPEDPAEVPGVEPLPPPPGQE